MLDWLRRKNPAEIVELDRAKAIAAEHRAISEVCQLADVPRFAEAFIERGVPYRAVVRDLAELTRLRPS